PSNPIGHPGPGGSLPNAYRPQVMSPSINQPGPRMHITNSPGVGYSSSSPVPYGTPCPGSRHQIVSSFRRAYLILFQKKKVCV
ncbi:unnamed protein product, partial [Rotaria sp. Silwood2]